MRSPFALQLFLALHLAATSSRCRMPNRRSDKQAALPRRAVAHAGRTPCRGGDGRCPLVQRLFHSRAGCAFAHLAAAIVLTVGDHRPTVVAPGWGRIDFVAALRAMRSCIPQLALSGPMVAPWGCGGRSSRSRAKRRAVSRRICLAAPPCRGDADDLAVVVVELWASSLRCSARPTHKTGCRHWPGANAVFSK